MCKMENLILQAEVTSVYAIDRFIPMRYLINIRRGACYSLMESEKALSGEIQSCTLRTK